MRKSRFAPVYLTLVLIALYLPIVVVVLYSFNANTSRFTFDFTGFSLQHYEGLLKDTKGLVAALKNSLILAGYSLALSVVLGTLGAVGMARRSFRGMNAAQTLVTLPIMVPEIILGMAFLAVFTFLDLPMGMFTPGVVSGALLAFAMSMDDFIISFFVTGATTTTLPLKVYSSVKTGVSPQVNALCTLTLFVVAVLVALSKSITRRNHV